MFICKRCGAKDPDCGDGRIAYGHCPDCSEEIAEGIAAGYYAADEVA